MTPTQRSLAFLRKQGWLCHVAERWNHFARIRQDMFGFIDILAVKGEVTMGVQTTSSDNVSKRVNKIADSPHVDALREAGWKLVVHGWTKGKRGDPRIVDCS